jgi:hypothetical protein
MLWGGGVDIASIVRCEPMELPMQTLNNLSRSLIALEPASTLIAVIEMSLSSWLVAGIVPGIERQPLKSGASRHRQSHDSIAAAAVPTLPKVDRRRKAA